MYPPGMVVPAPAAVPAAARVEKATSHLLMGPDWATNLEICDTINTDVWQTKDVVKAVKKRLQNKDPKVQFFTLMLLETMMKNCGEYVHSEVVEQNVLQEMVKIVQKKNDMQVRDKILMLLDSWQEAFGPAGKYPQYNWAYIELKRTGTMFPKRPIDAPPIFTPPATHPSQSYGSPTYASGSLNERMAAETGTLSLADLNNIRSVMELLNDMVFALSDRTAVKDEIITDLVGQCRSNQQKLMQFVSTTGNEELLKQGLEINDRLQSVLAKYDAIASGAPLPLEKPRKDPDPEPMPEPTTLTAPPPQPSVVQNQVVEEEDEDDEFAQIARRKNKAAVSSDQESSSNVDLAIVPADPLTSEASSSVASNALVPVDPPLTSMDRKQQDMIDLLNLSITLYNPTPEAETSTNSVATSEAPNQNGPTQPAYSNGQQQYSTNYQPYAPNQGYNSYNSYVAPWAQPAANPVQPAAPYSAQPAAPYPMQPQMYQSSYPAPPWVNNGTSSVNRYQSASYQIPNTPAVAPTPTYVPPSTSQPMQQFSSFSSRPNNVAAMAPETPMNSKTSAGASKPYYIPDNLFGDLIDVKSYGRSTSMSGTSGQPNIGGKK